MLTDYIRQTHGKRSATFIRKTYSDDRRLEVVGTNLAELIAKLSISHVQDAHGLTPTNGFYFDESVGTYKVNMVYLGLILRLADILDLDRDRTPNVLYKTIGFTSKVSLAEWEKHRSVDGWDISPTNIRFTMRSEHPVYQKSALQFMDWIDGELSDAHDITRNFPGEFERYKLELPLKVDRSRIKPKNDAYIFHDLQFALSRNEIINLLMTTELYGDTSLAVREMLQNSLDALRYRQALIKVSGHDWNQGKIQLEHFVNQEGHEVVRCTDNGVGMSEDIITRFLTNAGRSYYRSPEFEQERIRFREAGVDFDPCSQFGIGFMSYFMLGDTITLHTRRDYGPERGLGKPLIVEINGLSSIVVIRKGSQEQLAGTAIEIVGRKKPRFLDEYEDKVKLIEVVNGYALATEYPIEAKCSVSELENSLDIPPTIKVRKTQIEEVGLLNQVTFEQDFADIDPRLSGKVRTSFLTDEQGNFTLENYEAAWVKDEHDNSALLVNGKKIEYDFYKNGQTCEDGILVCGEPGRYQRTRTLANWANQINLGNDYFVLNVQGAIKPKLTPARTPPRDHFGEKTASWRNLQRLASQAHGRLWEKIASRIGHNLDSELFWQLCEIYKASVHNLRSETIYNNLKVPVFGLDGKYEWRSISSLQTFEIIQTTEESVGSRLFFLDGTFVSLPKTIEFWQDTKGNHKPSPHKFHLALLSISQLVLEENRVVFKINPTIYENQTFSERILSSSFRHVNYTFEFVGELRQCVSVEAQISNNNYHHPIVKLALKTQYSEETSELEKFASSLSYFLGAWETLALLKKNEHVASRWLFNIANSFLSVDWSRVDSTLHPPYKVWTKDRGIVEITKEDFSGWANTRFVDKY